MESTSTISYTNPDLFSIQDYTFQDYDIVPNFEITASFISDSDYIDYFVYDSNKTLLTGSTLSYYTFTDDPSILSTQGFSTINLDPEITLISGGFDQGIYNIVYNFFHNELGSNSNDLFYISEISSDRTELKLSTNFISSSIIELEYPEFKVKLESGEYFNEFYINFGNNQILIAVNILLQGSNVLIKLYEPLPTQFQLKSTCWINTKIADPIAFNVSLVRELEKNIDPNIVYLKGPNINYSYNDQTSSPTEYQDYTTLLGTTLTSSFQQVKSLLTASAIDINIDYTDFNNYVHFSSAEQRLLNFYYKASLIEGFQNDLNNRIFAITGSTSASFYTSESQATIQNKIDNIIDNFDEYEYFLYFTSGSTYEWPKQNSEPPYILYSTGSSQVLNWLGSSNENSAYYGNLALSASNFDNANQNNLIYTIPEYLRNEPQNTPYQLFIEMMGQHFDNTWIYIKDVTNKFDADNRLNYGISKDLVAQAIRDLGLKIYSNNFSSDDLFSAFLGLNPSGSLINQVFPNTTGSLPVPTGSGIDYITSYVTASSDLVTLDDTNKSIYKRLYHNLPYLLNKKGTIQGIKALIASYGIPNTVLRISEFGGKDKDNSNDWDYWYNKFNYAFETSGSKYISSSFALDTAWAANNDAPGAIAFRFKAETVPPTNYSQSLWYNNNHLGLVLTYTGSGLASGSYSGSITSSDSTYGNLIITDGTISSSVSASFFDGGWWSILVNSGSGGYTLYAKNKIYTGDDSTLIGFQRSSSLNSSTDWDGTISYFATGSTFDSIKYEPFSGSLQEIRYYNSALNENIFDNYVVNPLSIEGNTINSSPNQLAFRAPLGAELENTLTGGAGLQQESVHPKITGSWTATQSFAADSYFHYSSTPYFTPNTEYVFLNAPAAGIKNRITDKIRIEDTVLISGSTLSPFISIQQQPSISQSYTEDLNQLEAAFSPQNEINDDIIEQIGFFNIGDYIGDVRQISSSGTTYPNLDDLRNSFFEKYTHNYDLNDYIRLIKYFDNSLFKMIKDFVPARTSLSSGLVIKQHLLERNRQRPAQVDISSSIAYYNQNNALSFQDITITGSIRSTRNLVNGEVTYTASSDFESLPIANFTGSQGGGFATLGDSYVGNRPVTASNGQKFTAPWHNTIAESIGLNVTQSWLGFNVTPSGSTAFTQSHAEEFFTGELSGSTLIATTQSLNPNNPFLQVNTTPLIYDLITRNPASTATYYTGSLAVFDSATAKQNAIDFLITRTPGDGLMQAAFTFLPSGSKTGTITTTILGTGSSGGGINSKVLYLDKENAVGSIDAIGNGTLVPINSNYLLRSASVSGKVGTGPFYQKNYGAQSATGWASPYVGGTSPFFGMYPTNKPDSDPLLVDTEKTGALVIPDNYDDFVFGIDGTLNQTLTLYFEYPLQYYFVGVTVNNTDDTGEDGVPTFNGTDYTTLWQQVESLTMDWVDRTGTTVAVGSYEGGQPVPVTVSPLTPTRTSVYVTGNPVPVIGLGSGENAPFNTTASSNSNQNFSVITSPGFNVDLTYNDYNAILNNVTSTPGALGFYDLDYTQGSTIPVNYEAVISASIYNSGSSTLAPVQTYNWNANRSVLPRYSGSKLTGQKYNVWTLGDQSFGKEPVINNYGNVAFNIDFINGTYPEMYDGTALNVKNIGIFKNSSETVLIDQNNPNTFNFVLDQYLGYSQSAEIFSNDVSPVKDNTIRTLNGQIGWPANSVYFVPRQQVIDTGGGYDGIFWTSSLNSIILCSKDYTLYNQTTDDNDRYTTGSIEGGKNPALNTVISASYAVSKSIAAGENWYITLYTGSSYPLPTFENAYASGGLSPYNSGSDYNYSKDFTLRGSGVYKITSFETLGFSPAGISTDGNAYKITLDYPLPDGVKSIGTGTYGTENEALSMLMWKSNPFPQGLIKEVRLDYFPSGLGERGGYVIPQNFNTNLKNSLGLFTSVPTTPRINADGEVSTNIPVDNSINTTPPPPPPPPTLYLPVGRAGMVNGEQVTVGDKIYIWSSAQQQWNQASFSGGSGTGKRGV